MSNVQCARFMIYDELFRKLGTKDGQNHFCKLDKTKEMKTRDLNYAQWIKDEDQRVYVKEEEI